MEELMQRRINLLNTQYRVTVFNRSGKKYLQIGADDPQLADLALEENGEHIVRLGDRHARIRMVVKGETAFIRAFGRTLTLTVPDPVEQAAQETGHGGNLARAPMPGTVVEVNVEENDPVTKGMPLMTIESMKILTVITASRDGKIAKIHFSHGDTFDKNAILITLK